MPASTATVAGLVGSGHRTERLQDGTLDEAIVR
jgi:hypothetical protein